MYNSGNRLSYCNYYLGNYFQKKIANEQNLSHEIEIKTEDSEVSPIPPISEETIPSSEIAINVPDEIKQYKELLDSGAITQEEYDAKKKQLLEL